MKKLQLENPDVQEMNVSEMTQVQGGGVLGEILNPVIEVLDDIADAPILFSAIPLRQVLGVVRRL